VHRFVRLAAPDERLQEQAQLRARRQQIGLEQRGRTGGKRAQRAADVDEAPPRRGRCLQRPAGEAGGFDQR